MNIAGNIPNDIEHFLNISGYKNYKISNFGRVMNSRTDRILKPSVNAWGYLQVILSKNGKIKNHAIHKLVANEFIEKLDGKNCVDHTQYNTPTAQQCTDFGLVNNGTTILDVPYLSSAAGADILDAINDGIIFIAAAGNSSFKTDVQGGVDYNNILKESGFNAEYYHRGSSPSALTMVLSVGAISELQSDEKANYSNCGPRVNVYAPGTNIISSVLSGGTTDSRNNAYRIQK